MRWSADPNPDAECERTPLVFDSRAEPLVPDVEVVRHGRGNKAIGLPNVAGFSPAFVTRQRGSSRTQVCKPRSARRCENLEIASIEFAAKHPPFAAA